MPSVSQARVAPITGGGSGMGLTVSHHLASQGWKVSVADLNVQSGEAVAKDLGGIFTQVDVTKYEDQVDAFLKTWEEYGRIDFVYANAGVIDTMPWYGEQQILPPPKPIILTQEVCLTGVEYSAHLAMHYIRSNKMKAGSIIMTSSAAGIYPFYILPIYTAAKHGVVGLMRAMAPILAQENIRVNCTIPGAVQSNLCKQEV
ncbi:Fc.00g095490.m01.CDS01 [Cosmosporella sp. VM-42]